MVKYLVFTLALKNRHIVCYLILSHLEAYLHTLIEKLLKLAVYIVYFLIPEDPFLRSLTDRMILFYHIFCLYSRTILLIKALLSLENGITG